MSDDNTQRYIGELSGLITSGFEASRQRYDDMSKQIDGVRNDIKETNLAVKELDECIDRRADTITTLISTQHAAAMSRVDVLEKNHGERITTLETDKERVLAGWRAIVVTWGGAVGASGAMIGAMKLLGLIK